GFRAFGMTQLAANLEWIASGLVGAAPGGGVFFLPPGASGPPTILQPGDLGGAIPGRATGGPLAPFSTYEITEQGFETAEIGGRHFLFTGATSGYMTPAQASPSTSSIGHQGDVVSHTWNIHGSSPMQ